MNSYTIWLYIFVAFFSILGFFVSLVIFLTHKGSRFLSSLLAAMLFCLSYSLFGYLLYISGEFLRVPHLYRTPAFFSLCAAPLSYIYIRSSLDQSFAFKKWDFLFFIPAILYTLQLIPFYILPATEKIAFIEIAIQNKAKGEREPEGLLPPGWGFLFRMLYSLSLICSTYVLLFKWRKSARAELLKIDTNKEIFSWLVYLSIILSSTFMSLLVGHIFHLAHLFEQYRISTIALTVNVFFICIYLLFKPNILYGLKGWVHFPATESAVTIMPTSDPLISDDEEISASRYSFNQEQIIRFQKLIEDHFRENAPYLKHRYSVKDLSNDVGIPAYLLSAFINQEYGKNFSEFINDSRVSYLINFAKQNPDVLQQYTLEVFGQMGGFKSRASFIAAVKRKTGKTPSELFDN